MDCNSMCKIVVCVPIYYEICDDGRHVDYKTTYFQLVFYTNTTNSKDLSVWYRRGNEVWEQSGLLFNLLKQEPIYLFHSNFLLTTKECNWHVLLLGIRRPYMWLWLVAVTYSQHQTNQSTELIHDSYTNANENASVDLGVDHSILLRQLLGQVHKLGKKSQIMQKIFKEAKSLSDDEEPWVQGWRAWIGRDGARHTLIWPCIPFIVWL
jgi:hypothetical protein